MNFKQRKFAIGYLAITLIAILVIQSPLFGPQASPLSYSEFTTLSTDGLEMLLPQEKVEKLKRGSGARRFVAARVDDPGLVAEV